MLLFVLCCYHCIGNQEFTLCLKTSSTHFYDYYEFLVWLHFNSGWLQICNRVTIFHCFKQLLSLLYAVNKISFPVAMHIYDCTTLSAGLKRSIYYWANRIFYAKNILHKSHASTLDTLFSYHFPYEKESHATISFGCVRILYARAPHSVEFSKII